LKEGRKERRKERKKGVAGRKEGRGVEGRQEGRKYCTFALDDLLQNDVCGNGKGRRTNVENAVRGKAVNLDGEYIDHVRLSEQGFLVVPGGRKRRGGKKGREGRGN
jgi:hypothetical protein